MTFLLWICFASNWYDGSLEGWYYFQESPSVLSPEEAHFLLELDKRQQQETLALALLDPTVEHVADYLRAQRCVHEQSLRFSEVWNDVESSEKVQ